jgi:hypothetical protein
MWSDDGSGGNAVQVKQSTWNSLLHSFNEGFLHTHTHTHTMQQGGCLLKPDLFSFVYTNALTDNVVCGLICEDV